MMTTTKNPPYNPLAEFVERLQTGEALLKDSPENVLEVVGILKSYGVVLDAYSKNLIYIAEHQFLVFFPFFKYFNGDISLAKLLRHLWHDRINFEYAEYCLKAMMWHGGGGLDAYLDTTEFEDRAKAVIAAKFKYNPLILGINQLFPEFLIEQLRVSAYYTGLGQFWRVMADMFLNLSDRYDNGEIKSIPQVVEHIKLALVADAMKPITYSVEIGNKVYDLIPESLGLTFLADTAIPYVEAVFFRGTPFLGTVSLNAQAYQVPPDQSRFQYGALYADPLPIGGAGIPPTLLMQDMRHYLPEYLHSIYRRSLRSEDDLRVQICMSFQKSMFCVTSAAILGLLPYPLDTQDLSEQKNNQIYLEKWMSRLENSQLLEVNK
ncbi:CO2 hydration protein [Aphanizomenon flos-aquae NRERC-008]|uniref:CO2 hydration protein n=1 Tax=Aphanizomenon flos-aquae FACHB-1249 TaxID=2692889 RepID=A0ABR8INN8_APHFL|nr:MULTISPECIES: CO2 hydration protein [Aphanizomenon]MBD2390030.1 CO2 hydration protein [Aphanizomenon flos-aquae FACHB-1171]MBD2555709.1 CO2 hydration protein [Aphanizomenon flos-aquae FACHB-1290]MBD2630564.1 CO2 hydration protein [Aphanizomenon sp. FACHB-1399]MBD2641880.1 CO2 hydration protein [Aphanizomenon sp. FACHB-1401]MBD2656378.1 CO2 hydration protein [Aphanizomenon flos-aquae FACHB-1265]